MKKFFKFLIPALVLCLFCTVFAACGTEPVEVTLNKTTVEVFVNESTKLTAKTSRDLEEGEKLTWTSDKTNIATVDDKGNVKGVADGTAEITVSIGESSAKCTVTVKTRRTISGLQETASVNLDTDAATLQLTATCSDNGAVEWATSDAAVATVDSNGLVTIVDEDVRLRTVTITAKRGEASAQCVITITKPSAPVAYELTKGNNADCIANPDRWYYFRKDADSNLITFVDAKYTDNKENGKEFMVAYYTTEALQQFEFRYQPDLAVDTQYIFECKFISNTDGTVKVGDNTYELKAGEATVIKAQQKVSGQYPMNIKLEIWGGTEEAPVEIRMTEMTFTPGTLEAETPAE